MTKDKDLRVVNHDYEWNPKYYGVFVGMFCGMYMISSTLTPKLIEIHGYVYSAAIIVFPICTILADILTEVYGFNRTRRAIWTTLVCTILFAVFTQLAILLPPASFWQHQEGFAAVFATSFRIAAAGCLAWVVGEFTNTYVMSKMKILQGAKNMSWRFIASTLIGQFLDTIIFCTVAFAGTMPLKPFIIMIFSGWLLKVLYEVVALPLSIPVTKKVKRMEGIEHFDRQKISVI